jgi:plasmid stabilization system protein ParE
MKIAWSIDAQNDYHANIGYLLREWSENSAINFIEEVESVLEIIKSQPDLYPLCEYNSIRRAVIRKQITLFYKVEGDTIFLVRFWNNYQDPKSRKL